MKCGCGLECIYFPTLGWVCIKCDWKDIEQLGKECTEKLMKERKK